MESVNYQIVTLFASESWILLNQPLPTVLLLEQGWTVGQAVEVSHRTGRLSLKGYIYLAASTKLVIMQQKYRDGCWFNLFSFIYLLISLRRQEYRKSEILGTGISHFAQEKEGIYSHFPNEYYKRSVSIEDNFVQRK